MIKGRSLHTATIAASGSDSAAVAIGDESLLAVMCGATASGDFDASTAYLLFQGSADGTTYEYIRDQDGALIYLTVAEDNVNGAMYLDPAWTAAWPLIKVGTYSDKTAADPTEQTQTAETEITLISGKIVG